MSRDVQRLNGEMLGLSTQMTKLSIEMRNAEDKIMQKLEARLNTLSLKKPDPQETDVYKLESFGVNLDDYPKFRDSLQQIVFEGTT